MNVRTFQTLLKWLGKRTDGQNVNTPELFFKAAMKCEYNCINDWQLERCLALYYKEGVIPDFVSSLVRAIYGVLTVKEIFDDRKVRSM